MVRGHQQRLRYLQMLEARCAESVAVAKLGTGVLALRFFVDLSPQPDNKLFILATSVCGTAGFACDQQDHEAAMDVQRVFRGWLGRRRAKDIAAATALLARAQVRRVCMGICTGVCLSNCLWGDRLWMDGWMHTQAELSDECDCSVRYHHHYQKQRTTTTAPRLAKQTSEKLIALILPQWQGPTNAHSQIVHARPLRMLHTGTGGRCGRPAHVPWIRSPEACC